MNFQLPQDFWALFVINLPLLVAVFFLLHRKIIYMGVTVHQQLKEKDREIEFRESLRQEALADKRALEKSHAEQTVSMNELANVVKQSLELNDRLIRESLSQRWEDSDRR